MIDIFNLGNLLKNEEWMMSRHKSQIYVIKIPKTKTYSHWTQ